jgi:hypothetical protein
LFLCVACSLFFIFFLMIDNICVVHDPWTTNDCLIK